MLVSFFQDLRYASRTSGRNPVVTATAVLSLAIGIGGGTAIFTIADGLLFRPPAGVADPARLVDVGRSQDGRGFDTNSYPNFLDVRERSTAFSGMYAYPIEPGPVTLRTARGDALLARASAVSADYFRVLGARPALGRFFTARDGEKPGAPALAVLSRRLWADRFGSRPGVVGETLAVNGVPFTIAGVAERDFQGTTLLVPDLWYPLTMAPVVTPRLGREILASRASAWLILGARLAPGVTLARARAELDAIGRRLAREYPADNAGRGLVAEPTARFPGNTAPLARFVALLAAIVAAILAVACANVGGVLLARAAARRREVAVRLAIGAGRGRLVRQFLTESLFLFGLGAAAGLLLARGLVGAVERLLPSLPVPVGVPLRFDPRVIAFAAALALAASIVAGAAPAFHAARGEVAEALKAESGGSPRQRLRSAFVVAQIALSLLLVISAGLFLKALRRAAAVDPGFRAAGVDLAAFDLSIGTAGEAEARSAEERILEAVRGSGDVESASLTAVVPLSGTGLGLGRLAASGAPDAPIAADWDVVEPGYFRTLSIPLAQGRDFSDEDGPGAPDVAVVNETLVRRVWPDGNAVGKTLVQNDAPPGAPPRPRTIRVVGVARDGKYRSLDEPPRAFIWVPFRQQYVPRVTILARARKGGRAADALRSASASAAPGVPLLRVERLEDAASAALLPQRIAGAASTALGAVGLLLAAIGVYGVTAYAVARRTREIAVRIAVGAPPAEIARMVLRRSLALAGAGVAIGLVVSAAASRLLRGLLFGVPALDPATFAAAAALFLAVAASSSWAPAARAAAIAPLDALRSE